MERMDVFDQQYSRYYNLLYADKDYSGEVAYVDSVLKKYAPAAQHILEYGSGTGGHGLLLNQKGYSVYGIERSNAMAEVAKKNGLNCEVGDIITTKLTTRFDACIALFHVISYINRNHQLIQLFNNTRSQLKRKGIFVFDVWFTPAVMYQLPEVRVKKMEDADIEVTRIATPVLDHVNNIVDVNYQILVKDKRTKAYNEFKETHAMRHFGVPEIELLANHTGFSLLAAEEFMTGAKPSLMTWGVNFILQANDE
jgi:SAM-dependent methyltransferase